MILLPPDAVSHYECNRCGHRIEVEYFHDQYGHLSEHSIIWCNVECWNHVATINLELVACYVAVPRPLTIPIPVGRRMIQL